MEGETAVVGLWVAQTLMFAVFLAVVNERLVELFINPVFEKVKLDTTWLRYVALVTGLGITALAQVWRGLNSRFCLKKCSRGCLTSISRTLSR